MAKRKEQWKPKITNFRKEIVDGKEQWVEFEPSTYVIPAGHPYYRILKGICESELEKEGAA